MRRKQPNNRVYLQDPCPNGPQRHLPLNPPPTHPERHQPHYTQTRRDWQTFEVGSFPCGIFGDIASGDVEAREAREAGEHKEGEEELVERGAEAEGEGAGGGGDAEGDLARCQSLAMSPSSFQARDFPIEEIEEQSQWHESEGDVEVGGGGGGAEAVAHGREDGGEAAEAVEEGDAVGEVVGADEGEVAGVGVVEEADLLVLFWEGGGRS
ncbi:hypothetical protein LTS01_009773 [Friedmanniomyces endolithicus]|nr:hypothetical protein LTS01_009773 [Friedmanniomyces endolithicus]